MKSFGAFLLVTIVLAAFIIEFATAWCNCDFDRGGCIISKPAGAGYKCKCRYRGVWTCAGLELQCGPHESCPANCSSKECCMVGGGDCDGYG